MTGETPPSKEEQKDAPAVIMHPPIIMLIAIVVGVVLDRVFPLSFGIPVHRGLGGAFILIGMAGIIWSALTLRRAGTNIPTHRPALKVVSHGSYRYSRNPIYVAAFIVFAGVSFVANAPVMLGLMVPLFYVFSRHVIAPEEAYLTEKFGVTYLEYLDKVRRWV